MKSRKILSTAVTRHILPAVVGSILLFSLAGAETITMPGAVIAQGQTADVPIFVTDPGSGIVGVDIILRYDGSVIKASGINVIGADVENWSILHNIVEGVDGSTDEIRISGAAQNDPDHPEYGLPLDVTGTEPLLYVTFDASAASSPTSSALQFTLTDLNEISVSTNSDGSVLLGGDTGTVRLSPDPVRPTQMVTITVNDEDLNRDDEVVESVDVEVTSTQGAQLIIILTETGGSTGEFTGQITTVFDEDDSGSLPLEIKPGDQISVEYTDAFDGSGGSSVVTAQVSVTGGVDGTVSTTPDQILPGDDVTVTVQDADLGNSGTIQVTVRSKRDGKKKKSAKELESLSVTLSATGSDNIFTGTVATDTLQQEEVVPGNDVLEVKKDDLIEAEYLDAGTASGDAATRVSSPIIQVKGAHTGDLNTSVAVQAGDGLRIELNDPDLNTDPASLQSVDVTVSNNTNSDIETVSLEETGDNTGIFRAVPPLSTNGAVASSGDGLLQVGFDDAIVVTYIDLLDDDSMLKVISAAVTGVLWGDTSVNDKVGALDASLILQRSVQVIRFTDHQILVGNVNGSSEDNPFDQSDITAADAALVLQYAVGIINVFPVQSGNPHPHPYKRVMDERKVTLGTPEQNGSLLSLPVQMDETSDVLSGQMRLKFDPNQHRIASVTPAERTADYLVSSNVVEDELLIAFAGAEARGAGAGSVLEIQLEVIGASHQGAPLSIEQVVLNGGGIQVTSVEHIASLMRPQTFGLLPNWPNPFNPETTLSYSLPEESRVSLEVYDMLGQKVRTLVNDTQAAGSHEARWNGLDADGRPVASGTYLYRLEAGRFAQTRKMTLVR